MPWGKANKLFHYFNKDSEVSLCKRTVLRENVKLINLNSSQSKDVCKDCKQLRFDSNSLARMVTSETIASISGQPNDKWIIQICPECKQKCAFLTSADGPVHNEHFHIGCPAKIIIQGKKK